MSVDVIPVPSTIIGTALPAGTNLIGKAVSAPDTSVIYNGATALTPRFAAITASLIGVTNVIAAVTSKKIRVIQYTLTAVLAVNVKFQSHVTPTDLTGLIYCGILAQLSSPYCPTGLFETVSGEALDINLSGAVAVGGHLAYVEV